MHIYIYIVKLKAFSREKLLQAGPDLEQIPYLATGVTLSSFFQILQHFSCAVSLRCTFPSDSCLKEAERYLGTASSERITTTGRQAEIYKLSSFFFLFGHGRLLRCGLSSHFKTPQGNCCCKFTNTQSQLKRKCRAFRLNSLSLLPASSTYDMQPNGLVGGKTSCVQNVTRTRNH